MGKDRLDVETFLVEQGSIPLQDGNDLGSILFLEKLCRMETHVAQSLNDDLLAFQASVQLGQY